MSQGFPNQRLKPFRLLKFGRYTLLAPLSSGGMGDIFLALLEGSHGFDKLCVIKKILPHLAQDQDFVSRFVSEAHVLVKLSHGNIAQVLDMGVHASQPYIALEFVDGKDLRRVISVMRERQLPVPLNFVLSVMTKVLDALAYAHRKRAEDDSELNLVHRDVSPQNIIVSYEGEVKVIDFGLSKSAFSSSKTNPSVMLGKLLYMAPEQVRHRAVDRRCDLYSVGLCLWELVAGKSPFDGAGAADLMAKVANPAIPRLDSLEPLCPTELADVVAKALAVDPANRFQSAEEFRGKLQGILQSIDPRGGSESTSRFMREAFAAEYRVERRMLSSVKEQARALEASQVGSPAITLDEEPTETPMAAEALPSIVVENGLVPGPRRSEARTELNIPIQGKPPVSKPSTRSGKRRTVRRTSPPSLAGVRTDTLVIQAIVPKPQRSTWLWFVLPLAVAAAVGGYIAWDISKTASGVSPQQNVASEQP